MAENTGRVLLLDRADGKGWSHPGGFVEPGETPAAAAVRELEEETGYPPFLMKDVAALELGHDPSDGQLVLIQGAPSPFWYDFYYTVFVVYAREEFAPRLNPEHRAYTWGDPDDIGPHLHPGCALVLAYMRKMT